MWIRRDRDCRVLIKGATLPMTLDSSLIEWKGGQGVKYVTPVNPGVPTVGVADGLGCGFLLWGSDEQGDDYTSSTRNQMVYRFGTGGIGGWALSTVAFEQYTYTSRTSPGPLVPLVYNAADLLLYSLHGYWTKEDEWTLSGDPRAPNQNWIGSVIQPPIQSTNGQYYLTLQVFL